VTRDYFKLHSACALTHAAIDAVLEMQPDPRDVVSVQVETVSNNMKLDRQPHPNSLSGRFSLQYAVATAIVLGRGDPEAFTFRPEVARLAQKVQVTVAAALEAQWPDSSPARVTIETSAGAMTRTVDNPRGHHRRPVGADELRAKFLQLVGRAEGDLWWPRLTGLTEVQDVADVFARAH
jgi:2-methylcitrate dehydratase PrpD